MYEAEIEWDYDTYGTKMGFTIDDGCVVPLIKHDGTDGWRCTWHLHSSMVERVTQFGYENWGRLKDKKSGPGSNSYFNVFQNVGNSHEFQAQLEVNPTLKNSYEDFLMTLRLTEK